MDIAYDHIQEESYPEDPTPQQATDGSRQPASTINNEFQDAYKAISSSPWAARLGGFLGTVKKQGEQYYDTANKQASAGLTNLISHTRNLSVAQESSPDGEPSSSKAPTAGTADPEAHPARPDSLPADIVKEAESMLSRFRAEAAKRLKDIEKAEDAADEALLKFGTNIRSYLRDAVTVAPPSSSSPTSEVLYESKDSAGKKVVHATRFDAQLHVIHSNVESFLRDPVAPEWETWKADFDVEKKTADVAKDLQEYDLLREKMEKLVPEKVEYGVFWTRYYFLRHVIETEEVKRRELLKASAPTEEEEVAWDEDSDSDHDDNEASKPSNKSSTSLAASKETLKPSTSPSPSPSAEPPSSSLQPTPTTTTPGTTPAQPRRSNDEKSIADSDASYDLVSGATSRAPGSPQEKKKEVAAHAEESDEEDWE